MRKSRMKEKLRQGKTVLCVQLHFVDQSVYEMASLMGFDGIWMDLEHHGTGVETAAALMRASRVGSSDVLVRPGKGEYMRMSRLLEMGAAGIMYPRCNTADEAREVARWSRFAPLGQRGFDGGNPDMPYCSMDMAGYVKQANEETIVLVQIEDPAALEHVDAIAAVPGIDGLFFGPADFTVLSGIPGQFTHPAVTKAMERIDAAARKAGKFWGTTCFNTEHAQRLQKLGARFLCHGADLLMVKTGLEQIQSAFKPLGFSFENRLAGSGTFSADSGIA